MEVACVGRVRRRAVEALNQLGLFDLSLQSEVTATILCRHSEVRFNNFFKSTISACLASQGVGSEEDVMILLLGE